MKINKKKTTFLQRGKNGRKNINPVFGYFCAQHSYKQPRRG